MIQFSPSLSAPKPGSARIALLASGGTPAFASALIAALTPRAAAETEGETPLLALQVRQKPATDGKELPVATAAPEDEDKTEVAPVFAWFATVPMLPQPTPLLHRAPFIAAPIRLPEAEPETASRVALAAPATPVELAGAALPASRPSLPGAAEPVLLPAGLAATRIDLSPAATRVSIEPKAGALASVERSAPGHDDARQDAIRPFTEPNAATRPLPETAAPASIDPSAVRASLAPSTLPAPIAPSVPAAASAAPAGDVKQTPAADIPATRQQPEAVRIELPAQQAGGAQPIAIAAIQPRAGAVRPLASPLAAAAVETPAPRRQASREPLAATLAPVTAIETSRPHAVAPVADSQPQAQLDLGKHASLTAMIERIEALRDTPSARETSIRLSPDALGTVDVSIRQEGDRVHVHFNAETPAARAALAEAQPRLAELAESRGLRLGQTSIDGGAAGQSHGQRHDAEPRSSQSAAPAPAPAGDLSTDTDDRIA